MLDDESGQIGAFPPPLLLGVFLYEFLEDILSDECQSLLLQILRLTSVQCLERLRLLLLNLGLSLLRSPHAPHLVECVHIERQVVELAFIVRDRAVSVSIELHNTIDKVPDLLV